MDLLEEMKGRPSAELPLELVGALANPHITLTDFAAQEELVGDRALQAEVGYRKDGGGVWQVSYCCPMPAVTPDMLRWWYWWYPKDDQRYKAWYPESHESVGYRESDRDYFERRVRPSFRDNELHVVHRVGKDRMPLAVKYVKPEEFAFDTKALHKAGVPIAFCAKIGSNRGAMLHTAATQLFLKADDGLELVGRYWIGQLLPWKWMRKRMTGEELAHDVCEYSLIASRNLAERLPELYAAYGPGDEAYQEEAPASAKRKKKH